MKQIFLNVGCGNRKLDGFVNLDIEPGADLQVDVTRGLPYDSSSVHGIYSEHFIEHLSKAEALAFLRECRRVLVPNGVTRIATPDLDYVVGKYVGDWRDQAWLTDFGYEWIRSRCEMVNVAMREWGHKWLYDEEELRSVAIFAGLSFVRRATFGQSDVPAFRNLEYRHDSRLILEFAKTRASEPTEPLVSVLIPAYNPKYFRAALESALNQTYPRLEIVVSDDCPSDDIRNIVADCSRSDSRIRYYHNEPRLGAYENYLRCFSLATGDYIKFLNDDDILHPECVKRMVRCLQLWPDVTLVTSHRQRVDHIGNPLPDILPTRRPVSRDSVIDGVSLANLVLARQINFIGEPSTVMFRRRDLADATPNILSFGGRRVTWNVDVAMWLNLLSKGDAIYLVDSLSQFRQHPEQEQVQPGASERGQRAWAQLVDDGRRMGFLANHAPLRLRARSLEQPADSAQVGSETGRALGDSRGSAEDAIQVSIVIPVFNKVDLTSKCLDSLCKNTSQRNGFEVIVVDNGSSDGTGEYLDRARQRYETLRVIRNEQNLGFARACNEGARAANGQYIVFLNNDTIPHPGWLEAMLELATSGERVGVVGSRLLYPNGDIQHIGVVFNESRFPVHLLRGRRPEEFARYLGEPRDYQVVTGACMLVRADLFSELGGFDEVYLNGFEDVDLCLRAREKGYRVMYAPDSVLTHLESMSEGRSAHDAHNLGIFLQRWGDRLRPDAAQYVELIQRSLRPAPAAPIPTVASPTGTRAVVWHAPIFDPSGYADGARQFLLGLDSLGVALRAVPLNWSKAVAELDPPDRARLEKLVQARVPSAEPVVSVFQIFPPYFRRISGAAYHVGRTMYETDRIPEDWVAGCNQMDEIWVPSDFNLESFARSGVRRDKLVKVPEGIDTRPYRLDVAPLEIAGRRGFNFLSVFDWQWRKGWDVLLSAFIEEFDPEEDVALVIKTWSSSGRTLDQIKAEAASYLNLTGLAQELPPNIIFLEQNLPTGQLPRLYRAADSFVLPTRGEGWGRPFMEAMLEALPVIGTRCSGQLEFMNDANAFLIDCQAADIPRWAWAEVPAFRGHRWSEPSKSHVRQLMRRVFEDRQDGKQKGQAARAHIIANFDRDVVARRVKERLDAIAERLPSGSRPFPVATHAKRSQQDDDRLRLIWEGSQFVHHSLALVNRELCIRLAQDKDVDLSIIPYEPHQFGAKGDRRFKLIAKRLNRRLSQPAEFHVRHQWPPNLTPPPQGRWIVIQPWEFGSTPKAWVEAWRDRIDDLWVPSNYVRECYVRSGMPADRVHVVPNGVDVGKFRPQAAPLKLRTGKSFKFLFVGGTIGRKGIDILLNAYVSTFHRDDDVCLVIKDMGGQSFYKGQTANSLIARCQSIPGGPEIEYIDRTLDDREMVGLYTACDCLVHPYRGEGFGLPIAEAMACGLPVIITEYGAALDFCNPETAYFIPATERRKPDKFIDNIETVDCPWWAEPDVEALKQLLRHVVENRAEARAKGRAASAFIRANFTWDHAARAVKERLQALRSEPVRRFVSADTPGSPAPERETPRDTRASDRLSELPPSGTSQASWTENAALVELANKALLHEEAGEIQEALACWKRMLEAAPGEAEVLYNLGRLELVAGDPNAAQRHLEESLGQDPENPMAHAFLGLALRSTGDLAGALTHLEIASRATPSQAPVLRSLADAYLEAKRYEDAISIYNSIIEASTGEVSDLIGMAESFKGLGQPEFARECYKMALEVAPDLEEAAAGLAAIEAA